MVAKGWTTSEDLDMENASDLPPPPLEDGIYQVEFSEIEPFAAGADNKPALKARVKITRKYGEAEGSLSRNVTDTIMLSKAANWRLKGLCDAAKVAGPKTSSMGDADEFCTAILESTEPVYVRLRINEWQKPGEVEPIKNNKIDRYFTADLAAKAVTGGGDAAGEAPAALPVRARGGRKGGQQVAAA